MINAKRIEEMKRLSAEVTEGVWLARGLNSLDYARVEVDINEYESKVVAQSLSNGDIKFIAESRQFVPDIIAAYEEQAEEISLMLRDLSHERKMADAYREAYDIKLTHLDECHAEIAKLREALTEIKTTCMAARHGNFDDLDVDIDAIEVIVEEALK